MINITINVQTVKEMHEACNQIINGYEFKDNAPVTEKNPADDLMDYVPGKSVETATEQAGSTETGTSENAGASHPPIPDNVTPITGTQEATGPELDNDGLPWDERIHSTKKSKNQDDTWKVLRIPKFYKDRNDEPGWLAYVNEVKAELRADSLYEQTESENPDPNSEFNPPAGQQATSSDPVEPVTFDHVIKFLSTITDHSIVLDVCEAIGIVNVFELEKKPELISDFYSRINALATLDE